VTAGRHGLRAAGAPDGDDQQGEEKMKQLINFAAGSVLALAWATASSAQAPQAAGQGAGNDNSGIRDIVVTATRQSTNLQDTPIAITAVTAEALEERGITNIGDLTSVVPNAQFRRVQGAFGPGISAFIRGLGSGDTSIANEATVAFYIDDVYYPMLLGANFDLLDVDHVEVLRGPQGTLFGRNALAGAINIVGKQPNTRETSAYVETTVGSFARRDLRAGFNLPIAETAAIMVSGMTKNRRGYQRQLDFTCEMNRRGTPQLAGSFPYTNPLMATSPNKTVDDCTIGYYGGDDIYALRGSVMWQPMPTMKLTVTGEYIRDRSDNAADYIVDIDPARVTANVRTQAAYFGLLVDNRFSTGDPYSTYVTYTDRIPAGTVIPGNTYYNGTTVGGHPTRGGYTLPNKNNLTNWGVAGKLNWDLGNDIDLTAVLAYRNIDEIHTFDTDGTPLVVEHVINHIINKYTHGEVRLSGKWDFMDWVLGGFYYDAAGIRDASLIMVSSGGQRRIFATYDPTSKAVFANATVRPFGEKFGIVLGARYSDDQTVVKFTNLADITPVSSDIRFDITPAQKKFSWKAGANYQAMDNMLFYASAATGNSLPGHNARPLQKTQIQQYDGNDNIAYELGAKLDLFDRRLRLNAAVFYTDFKNRPTTISGAEATLSQTGDIQPGNQVLVPLPGGPPGSTMCRATVQTPQEAAAGPGVVCFNRTYWRNQPAKVRGFELEYTINPVENLVINGSVGWSKFTSPDISERAVNRRQNNPFWTANAGIQYRIEASAIGGSITPRLDWTYESSQIVSGTSTKYNYLMPQRSLFNGRITYDNADHDFTVALGVTNLFDKFYYRNVFDYQGLGYPQTDAQPAPPREWYLTLTKRF
jgi:iron complex outermembrane receptor protein